MTSWWKSSRNCSASLYHKPVGFYLWLDGDLAWAKGTYEYRPMGTAVISSSDLFRRRDFSAGRKVQAHRDAEFAGQFASLGHLNTQLQRRRKRNR
jgi:hypothetical protein